MEIADVIVVGSGPSGAHAAAEALRQGLRVAMLDGGIDEPEQRALVPSRGFDELRRTDEGQRAYFLGDAETDDDDGPHLTPPRAYVTRDAAQRQPVISDTFVPVQSLALGGLGAAWGAGAVTFEVAELERAGLPPDSLARYYEAVIREIGVSGSADDDIAPYVSRIPGLQPAAQIDSNAHSILAAYDRNRDALARKRFSLGRPPLALLTQRLHDDDGVRDPNPYTDMDFYGDSNGSIYRPRYTIEALRRNPAFTYIGSAIVRRFSEEDEFVRVSFTDSASRLQTLDARRLILAAGAINTARIVLRSRNLTGLRVPLLCNPMSYLIAVNTHMLGKRASDRRHSLAQLLAVHTPAHREHERVIASLYSYRSLLQFRLVAQMPLPATLGLLAARTLATALTIVGVHHPERFSPHKWIALDDDVTGLLRAEYRLSDEEERDRRRDVDSLERCLRSIGCFTVRRLDTRAGASIHYAGTVPQRPHAAEGVASDERGRLVSNERVYLADSATWTALPAKGLTLTLMANARRIAAEAAADARNEAR